MILYSQTAGNRPRPISTLVATPPGTLITALFCDLTLEKEPKIPKQGELRERELRKLVKKRKKPVVLIIDEAHDLHRHTLTGLKRLIEMLADGGGKLSILLAGHPKLRNDLRNPNMEEIGNRTVVFSLEGVTGSQREYIEWLLVSCARNKTLDIGNDADRICLIVDTCIDRSDHEACIDFLLVKRLQ